MAVMNVSSSRISPTSMMSGSSRTACFMPISKSFTSMPIFALVDQAFVFGEDEFDRVFERQNVLAVVAVDPVEHRGDRRALARAGHAGQQHHALDRTCRARSIAGGRYRPSKSGIVVVHAAGDQADVPELLQQVHAEPPRARRRRRRCGRSRRRRSSSKILRLRVVHHRKAEPHHLFVVDRPAVQRPQRRR